MNEARSGLVGDALRRAGYDKLMMTAESLWLVGVSKGEGHVVTFNPSGTAYHSTYRVFRYQGDGDCLLWSLPRCFQIKDAQITTRHMTSIMASGPVSRLAHRDSSQSSMCSTSQRWTGQWESPQCHARALPFILCHWMSMASQLFKWSLRALRKGCTSLHGPTYGPALDSNGMIVRTRSSATNQ